MSKIVVLTSQLAAVKATLERLEVTMTLSVAQRTAAYEANEQLRRLIKKLLLARLVDAGHLGLRPERLV